jgi:anti-sigma-K factor RskA
LATCAECQDELAELVAAVDALPEMIAPMDPPPALRRRLEAAVLAEPVTRPILPPQSIAPPPLPPAPFVRPPQPVHLPTRWWSRAAPWAAVAAALLLVALGLVLWNLQLRQQIAATTPQAIALAPTDAAPGASGEVRIDPRDNLLLLDVRDLPPLAEGQVYEVWLIGPDGNPVPSGVFDQSTDQHAIVADRNQFDTLAITAEPGPLGTAAPTGEIVATAAL